MSQPIMWEEPPPPGTERPRKGKGPLFPLADALRSRPNEWALIATHPAAARANQQAQRVKQGYGAFAPRGAFQAVSRKVDGEHRVYARFVGEQP